MPKNNSNERKESSTIGSLLLLLQTNLDDVLLQVSHTPIGRILLKGRQSEDTTPD